MSKLPKPAYELTLVVDPRHGYGSDPEGIRRLRAFLKQAVRAWGLRCTAIKPASPDALEGNPCDLEGDGQ